MGWKGIKNSNLGGTEFNTVWLGSWGCYKGHTWKKNCLWVRFLIFLIVIYNVLCFISVHCIIIKRSIWPSLPASLPHTIDTHDLTTEPFITHHSVCFFHVTVLPPYIYYNTLLFLSFTWLLYVNHSTEAFFGFVMKHVSLICMALSF